MILFFFLRSLLLRRRRPLILYTATWTALLTLTVAVASFAPEVAFVWAASPSSSFARACGGSTGGHVQVPLDGPAGDVVCVPARLFVRSKVVDLVVPILLTRLPDPDRADQESRAGDKGSSCPLLDDRTVEDGTVGEVKGSRQCGICGKVFGSGQALEGHKRSHLAMSSVTVANEEEEEEEELVEMPDLLDLNLPAVAGEDSSNWRGASATVADAEFESWWAGSNLRSEAMVGMIVKACQPQLLPLPTNQQYDDSATIPSYTSVELRRILGLPRPPLTDEPLKPPSTCTTQVGDSFTSNSSTVTTAEPQEFDPHDFGEDVFAAPKKVDTTANGGLENRSSCSDCTNDTSGRGSSICGSSGQRGFTRMTPPLGYICHRCNVPGHFIQHCPSNGDPSYDIRMQKQPTEIQSTPPANDLPPELHCPVCKALMKDAAFTKCCFRSICDKCIRDYISTKSTCLCGSMKMSVDDIIPNITVRKLINRIRESTASSREKSGSLVQDDGASKVMFFGTGVHSLDKIMEDTNPSESNKHELLGGKKIKKERATQDYGTLNCGGRPLSSSDTTNPDFGRKRMKMSA